MAAYGLYSHIQSNKRRSIALLIGLFFLVYAMAFAGALFSEALTDPNVSDAVQFERAIHDFLNSLPWVTIGTALWVLFAYTFNQVMIDAVTGVREVMRAK